MKYEIEIQDETYVVDVSKTEEGYAVRIGDGAQMNVQKVAHSETVLQLLYNNRSFSMRHALRDDEQEIHWEGSRLVGTAVDPRKKVLQLAGVSGGDVIASQMPGRVLAVSVQVGDVVAKGDIVATVEAMKMENPLKSPRDGVVEEVCAKPGDLLEAKGVVVRLEPLA